MKLVKYPCLIINILIIIFSNTGCSYISDMVESIITDRASFSVSAEYSGGNVILTWDETDYSDNFAGIEIYRTSEPNDEFCSYTRIASRYTNGTLEYGSTTNFIDYSPPASGIYFYRIGLIHWDEDKDHRTLKHGYWPEYPDSGWDDESPNYNNNTDINAISGYAMVVIP